LPSNRNNRLDRNKIFAILEAALAVVVWGAAFIAIKIALREVQPLTVIWLRFGMGVIVLGIAGALRKRFAPLTRKHLPYFALLGFLGICLHLLLQSNGLLTSDATTKAWIVATTPVFIARLGLARAERKFGPRARFRHRTRPDWKAIEAQTKEDLGGDPDGLGHNSVYPKILCERLAA
jgi:drug/metabolite transporter (DMT)-like permease